MLLADFWPQPPRPWGRRARRCRNPIALQVLAEATQEMFRSSYFADLSLNQWTALTPPQLLQAHFPLDQTVMENLHKKKSPIVPA